MEMIFYIGIIFVLGSLTGWISHILNIPRVVSYLILGLLIGPETLKIIPTEFVQSSHSITDISLSIIAVLIGATLKFSSLKGHGKEVLYITLSQSLTTFIIVTIGFIYFDTFLNLEISHLFLIALLLGGIATATAPATPLAIVKELRAKGRFTSTLLAIVALDDVVSLMIFTLALTIGVAFMTNGSVQWINTMDAFVVLLLSVLLGIVAGVLNFIFEKFLTHSKAMETISTLGLIFLVYSISEYYHLEPLLSAMVMGIVMVNTSPDFELVHKEIDNHLANIIFMLFFIISAMHLKLDSLITIPVLIALYTFLRLIGKIFGSYIGAIISGSSQTIKKYMGIALFPQAGVAIGLALSIQNHTELQNIAPIILNIIIATTFVHELIGPFMTKYAIEKSGESKKGVEND
ncbi:MAG: cation:proton antiporter [Sulfurimonas sp.]|nr:cation:proton antiporter [Sulfurimonas sp.]